MENQAPPKIAVVGRNVSAALCLLRAAPLMGSRLTWFQGPKDLALDKDETWVLLRSSDLEGVELAATSQSPVPRFEVFWDGHRHAPLEVGSPAMAPAVLAKIRALALWSDISPSPWTKDDEPDPTWTQRRPLSEKASGPFSLVRRGDFLAACARMLKDQGVHCPPEERRVLGIQRGRKNQGGHSLIQNAPFGSAEADHILWTSPLARLHEETPKGEILHETPLRLHGRWRSWGCWVPYQAAAALPRASIWTPGLEGRRFVETGLLESGCLARVFAIDEVPEGRIWLQIEIYEEASRRLEHADLRPDHFLWTFCPHLQRLKLEGQPLRAEELCVLEAPGPLFTSYAQGMHFWTSGGWGDFDEVLRNKKPWG
jgi:hypothetical protein